MIPSVGSGTYSPGPNMGCAPSAEGWDRQYRSSRLSCLYRSQNPRYSVLYFSYTHIVAQDHRAVKRVTRLMLGFKSFDAAQETLAGIELMHMLKKRPPVVEAGDEGLTAVEQFYALAA